MEDRMKQQLTRAELKIIEHVLVDGCLPARRDWRTMRNLEKRGVVRFDAAEGRFIVDESLLP
jgi:hypothetical protein